VAHPEPHKLRSHTHMYTAREHRVTDVCTRGGILRHKLLRTTTGPNGSDPSRPNPSKLAFRREVAEGTERVRVEVRQVTVEVLSACRKLVETQNRLFGITKSRFSFSSALNELKPQ